VANRLNPPAITEEERTVFTGTVTSRHDDPIDGATVTLVRLDRDSSTAPWPAALTDAQGTFVVTDIEPGPYQILAMAEGYQTHASLMGYHFGVERLGAWPIRLGRPGLRSSFGAVGALEACVAALAAMGFVLASAHRFWRPHPQLRVPRVARALIGLGLGVTAGLTAALLANGVVRLVSNAGPAFPDGAVLWARYSGYGAIGFAGGGVAPLLGLWVAMSRRSAVAPAWAATLAGCGGMAAGFSMCRALVTKGFHEYLGMAISCPPVSAPVRLTYAHMQVVCVASGVVVALAGLSVSLVIRWLNSRHVA